MNHTLDYYNKNAQQFSKETISVDFTKTQDRFLNYLTDKGYILDFGCGSGRDTKYFLDKGFQVKAVDGSKELCRLAAEYTGIKVGQMLFEDLDEKEKGIHQDLKDIEHDIEVRDYKDSHREISPLKKADDAIELDTTNLTIDEVVAKITEIIQKKQKN